MKWKMLVNFMVIWNILRPFDILNGHLVIKWQFGIFFPVLVYYIEKNLATLLCLPEFFEVVVLRSDADIGGTVYFDTAFLDLATNLNVI
jgi:hypothetical protein